VSFIAFTHLIVEKHCLYGIGETEEKDSIPIFCKYGVHKPGYHCLANDCQCAGHAPAPHEIAYSHEDGEVTMHGLVSVGIWSPNHMMKMRQLFFTILGKLGILESH
jgi:hypothetical protein